jgi:hypothetical protein
VSEGTLHFATQLAIVTLVATVGVMIVVLNGSRLWRAIGVGYAVGGAALAPVFILPLPCDGWVCGDSGGPVVGVLAVCGFVCVLCAAVLTLVALGRHGRRRFAALWLTAALVVGIIGFLNSTWAARYDPVGRCFEGAPAEPLLSPSGPRGHAVGGQHASTEGMQVWPPGVQCSGAGYSYFVPARVVDGVILAAYAVGDGFVLAYPLTGLGWLLGRARRFAPRFS